MDYKNNVWETPDGPGAFIKFTHDDLQSINNKILAEDYKNTDREDRKNIKATFRLLKTDKIKTYTGDQIKPISFQDIVKYVNVATKNCRYTFYYALKKPERTSLSTFLKIAAFFKMPKEDAIAEWEEAKTKEQLEKIKKNVQSV